MIDNPKYNQERKCEFYTTDSPGQRSKGGAAIAIKKEIIRRRPNIRTILQVVALEVYLAGKRKRTICSI